MYENTDENQTPTHEVSDSKADVDAPTRLPVVANSTFYRNGLREWDYPTSVSLVRYRGEELYYLCDSHIQGTGDASHF